MACSLRQHAKLLGMEGHQAITARERRSFYNVQVHFLLHTLVRWYWGSEQKVGCRQWLLGRVVLLASPSIGRQWVLEWRYGLHARVRYSANAHFHFLQIHSPSAFLHKSKDHIHTDLPQDGSRTQENCLQSASAYLHISCAFLQAAENPVCSSWDKGVDEDWEEHANAKGADAAEGDDDSEPSVYKGEAVLCLLFCRIEGSLYVVAGPPIVWVVLRMAVDHPRLIVVVSQQNIVGI